MFMNLLLGLSTMIFTLLLQAILTITAIRYYRGHAELLDSPFYISSLIVIGGFMLILVIGNLAQIAIWGTLFQLLGEFEQFANAFYHSMVNFSTLGYGDIVISEKHRLLGALEALNGMLMIGLSTAIFTAAFQDMLRRRGMLAEGE